jgi:hypothetical protein
MIRYHDVRQLTTAELERTKRDLHANLGLITPDSPAHVPIQAHIRAIDAELAERAGNQLAERAGNQLAERAGNQKVNGSAGVSTGTEPAGCDPLTALSNEYGAEWKVWKPGRYAADHRRVDVSLISDTVPGLAEKLRAFTELIKDLP